MHCLFSNNAVSTLAGAISNTATNCVLASGSGVLFPHPTTDQFFVMSFQDAVTGMLREIVYVTAVTGDTLTIVRGQEGTSPLNWNAGDIASHQLTAGQMSLMAQDDTLQEQAGGYALDAGSINQVTITLSPIPSSYAALLGAPIRIKKANSANTGAVMINVNGLGNLSLLAADGGQLLRLPANGLFTVVYDGTNFILQSYGFAVLPQPLAPVRLLLSTSAAGSFNFTVPEDTYFLMVEILGGGGAGGGNNATYSGGGGGAGGHALGWIEVTPGQVISYTVGAGGAGVSGATGNAGGSTSFGAFMSASGGGGGQSLASAAGGGGGVGAGGEFFQFGGDGGDGTLNSTGTYSGGNGGASAWGGGSSASTTNNVSEAAFGSGGGGTYGGSSLHGNPGNNGFVMVWG